MSHTLSRDWKNPIFKPVFMVTGEWAHIDFQTVGVSLEDLSRIRTPSIFAALDLWCHPSNVEGQSKLSNAKPFYPIIFMCGWADASDSLARPGQDWPDRLLIRPATLVIEVNTVCFSPALVLHRSAVTYTQSQSRGLRKPGSKSSCSFCCKLAWSYAGNRNILARLCFTGQYRFSSMHHPLCRAPEFRDIIWFSWWENWSGMEAKTQSHLCEFQVHLWLVFRECWCEWRSQSIQWTLLVRPDVRSEAWWRVCWGFESAAKTRGWKCVCVMESLGGKIRTVLCNCSKWSRLSRNWTITSLFINKHRYNVDN